MSLKPAILLFAIALIGVFGTAMNSAEGYGPLDSYGSLSEKPTVDFKPADPPVGEDWKSAKYAVLASDLSPAALYVNHTNEQHLFGKLQRWRLGGPSGIAYMGPGPLLQSQTALGVQIVKPDMIYPWIIVWFNSSKGWGMWDSPWLVVLQHKPNAIETNEDGLHLHFDGEAGVISAMPLYGYYKPGQREPAADDPMRTARDPRMPASTASWGRGIDGWGIMQAIWWSQVLRDYPIRCDETFSVDRSKDRLILRETFEWFETTDDWGTKPLKFAPIPPSLGLALMDKRFPAKVSEKAKDPDYFTPYGPYLGVEGHDRYDVDLNLLQYVNETEVQQEPDLTAHPGSKAALNFVVSAMKDKFPASDGKWSVDFGDNNFCWAAMSDRWYPQGLAYVDPATQANAKKSLHNYFADWVIKEERFKPFKDSLLLEGPGIGSWGGYDDAGKFSANLLVSIWSYANYTGDWDLIKERWPLIKKLFVTPLESDWKSFGRVAIAELGDEASPPLAMARMAYKVGDADTYLYASYVFARELTHQFIKQNGAQYFRKYQPYHSMEPIPENVFITNLWGSAAGWQIDGPTYPKETGERQSRNRWVRFGDADAARFDRDAFSADVKKEMDDIAKSSDSPYAPGKDDGHIAPSQIRLRSLLLNESPEDLLKISPVEQWSAQPDSGKVALGLSILRTTKPSQFSRLIPKEGKPSPFVMGLERQVTGDFNGLVQDIAWEYRPKEGSPKAYWPIPVWHFWKPLVAAPDSPVGDRWPFGESRPAGPDEPKSAKWLRLNWNAQVTTFDF